MRLAGSEDFDPGALCKLILDTEKSYPVIGLALELLHSVQPEKVGPYVEKLKMKMQTSWQGPWSLS